MSRASVTHRCSPSTTSAISSSSAAATTRSRSTRHGRITYFEEKPEEPRSTLSGIALYFYPRHTLPLIREYLGAGNNPDQPGRLVQWLYPRVDVYTWQVPGQWYDIGDREQLEEADRVFSQS